MKRCSAIATALLLLGLTAFWQSHPASGQADAGWVTLFDGSNLNDWNQIGDANWKIVDGAVQADKGNGFLVSKNSYTDFQLRAEFWVDTAAHLHPVHESREGWHRQRLRGQHLRHAS